MFDDFDLYETCEEYYPDEEWEECEDFPDDYMLEQGFNPYMGCYDWDC